jgi:tripartite ATP-independent transporter DctP family solute receptor
MDPLRRIIKGWIAALLAVIGLCGVTWVDVTWLDVAWADEEADQYKAEYALSMVLPEHYPFGWGGKRWAELIRAKTNGRIVVRTYPGVSLVGGDQTKEFIALRQGIIDLAVGSTINWSPQVKQLNLFSLPFLTPDHRAFDALVGGEVGAMLFAQLELYDVIPLAWGENGFRELSNARRPITRPQDLEHLKIRVVGSPVFTDTMKALGAEPVQLTWADLKPAMLAGMVDGQENPLAIFKGARLCELNQKHLTLWGYVADPLVFVVNRRVWETWSEEDRHHVRDAALQAAEEETAMVRRGQEAELKAIRACGVTVTHLTPEQKAAFKQATRDVYARWANIVGRDLVHKAEAAVARR